MKFNAEIFHQSQYLTDNQLLPPDILCPLCGSKDRQTVCILQENPQVLLLKCTNCMAASASRIPTNEALSAYYQNYYSASIPSIRDERVTIYDTQRFGLHLANRLNEYLDKTYIRIVDFGGGDGSISLKTAEQLIKRGFNKVEITVVDYSKTIATTEDKNISLVQQDTIDALHSLDYDIVIASAIIEHIPEPRTILIRLLNLLDKGGIFYARSPYVVPFIRLFKLLGIKWDFTFPAHIYDFGQDFWESFFSNTLFSMDFVILESRPSIVETTFKDYFLRTLFAYMFKAPWYLFGRRYTLVAGWEIFGRKNSDKIGRVDM